MEIKIVDKESIPTAANLIRLYWKDRKLFYTQQWMQGYLEHGIKRVIKEQKTFVLKENERVIGTATIVLWEGKLAEIKDLVIKKEKRNQGYGKKLLEHLIEWCKRNNVNKVIALSPQSARFFLEKNNFKLEGFLKDHFKKGENLILMALFPEKTKETQLNLKEKLDDMHKVQIIEKETSSRLRSLSTKF